jgi:hypothetical protein
LPSTKDSAGARRACNCDGAQPLHAPFELPLLLLLLLLQIAGPIMRGIRGMSSLLLESEDAGFLLQVRRRHHFTCTMEYPGCSECASMC